MELVDGCAIFWKSERFDLAEPRCSFEFASIASTLAAEGSGRGASLIKSRVVPQDNVAMAVVLRVKGRVGETGQVLAVCNTHLYWNPEFCDVKLVQTMMLAHELHKLLLRVSDKYQVCGDPIASLRGL